MFSLVEQSEKLHRDIVKKAIEIEGLQGTLEKRVKENEMKLGQLEELKVTAKELEEKRDFLSARNETMRGKLDQLEKTLEEDGSHTKHLTKQLLSLLGLNLLAEPSTDNLIDLKISFKQDRKQFATLVYDPVTEDYDLTGVHPEHRQFRNLRDFLRESKDIQGFLFTFRRKILNERHP